MVICALIELYILILESVLVLTIYVRIYARRRLKSMTAMFPNMATWGGTIPFVAYPHAAAVYSAFNPQNITLSYVVTIPYFAQRICWTAIDQSAYKLKDVLLRRKYPPTCHQASRAAMLAGSASVSKAGAMSKCMLLCATAVTAEIAALR
jgi:hypothetical protein